MAQSNFTDADVQGLEGKLNGLNLTQGESAAMAAMIGGELGQESDVEPYISVKVLGRTVGTVRIRTPFGTITSARRPS